jgi:hypothetical protein
MQWHACFCCWGRHYVLSFLALASVRHCALLHEACGCLTLLPIYLSPSGTLRPEGAEHAAASTLPGRCTAWLLVDRIFVCVRPARMWLRLRCIYPLSDVDRIVLVRVLKLVWHLQPGSASS